MAEDEPKIIIDEGWKEQVQREKELAAGKTAEEDPEPAPEPEASAPEEPEAGFIALVSSLATQCLFALGLIAPQDQQQITVDINGAKYLIDLLLMLREKTKGNLTPEEEGTLTETLAELQRVFVVRAQQAQEATLQDAGIDMNNLRGPGA